MKNIVRLLVLSLVLIGAGLGSVSAKPFIGEPKLPFSVSVLHQAAMHGSIPTYANTCGIQPVGQNWCVGLVTGYTVFTPSAGTKIVLVSSSAPGNCTAVTAASLGITSSTQLSSISSWATTSCSTLGAAQALMRNNQPDWMVLKRSDTWAGSLNSTSNDNWGKSGLSNNELMLVIAGGTGARPIISQSTSDNISCWTTNQHNGEYMAFVGLNCESAVHDPASPFFQGATLTADTGVANCGTANVICNINAGAGIPSQIYTSASFSIIGNGINSFSPLTLTITGAVTGTTNVGQCKLTVSSTTGVAIGQAVAVTGIAGATGTACNATTTVSAVDDSTHLELAGTTFAGTYSSGGSVAFTIAAAQTSILMNANASFTATQMKIQIQTRNANAGVSMNGTTNTLIIEDDRFDYGAFATVGGGTVAGGYPIVNQFFRRSIFNGSTQNTANLFIPANCLSTYSPTCPSTGQITIEENASNFGAWNPNVWAYFATSLDHTWYLHNPQAPIYIHGNSVFNNAADGQYRDCGTAINNLFWKNSGALAANLQDNPCFISYNVVEQANDNIVANRTATAAATSGTVLSIDGVLAAAIGSASGNGIVNLSNPGSIPNTAFIASARDGFSVNLSTAITAGIRGNGVQIGDNIQIWAGNGYGILANISGIFVDNGPATIGVTGEFATGSIVSSVSAALPAIVTEPSIASARSQDEPFQFKQAPAVNYSGSGYGASVTGTLTWAGAGCSVNPVLNASTNSAGNITTINSITTAGTCSTQPGASIASWTPSAGLSVGTGVTIIYSTGTPGALPAGLSLNTWYCADPANGSSTAYPVYAANGSGLCAGGTDIDTHLGTTGSNIARTGSTLFKFSIVENSMPAVNIPSYVTADATCAAGTNVFVGASFAFPQTISGSQGGTTAKFISSDKTTLVTCDPSIAAIGGSVPVGDGGQTFLFNLPNNPNTPIARFGPNNLFINQGSNTSGSGSPAIIWETQTSGNNGSGNYIYYWSKTNVSNNTSDVGFSGTNLPALATSQVMNCGTKTVPCSTIYPNANVEAYDAANNGSGFNGTVTCNSPCTFNPGAGSSYDGGTLVINSGTAPAIFDYVFCTGCAQFMQVVSGSGTSFTVSAPPGTLSNVGPVAMTNGSGNHYIAQAMTQNAQSGWNTTWIAAAANNYMRSGQPGTIPCGSPTAFLPIVPPACPQQNWLLERDINPASNDNSPVGLAKAA